MAELYKKIVDYIEENIQNKTWNEGDLIPTEMELCSQFSVSRSTVRNAMQKLQNKGLLKRIKGKGTLVTKPKILENTSLFLESFSEELKEKGIKTKTEVLEQRTIKSDAIIAKALRLKEGEQVIKIKRLRYIDGSFGHGSIVLTTSYFIHQVSFLLEEDLEHSSIHASLKDHGIQRSFTEKAISAIELDEKSARLLGMQANTIAITITSTTTDQDGKPMEYCISIYPVERNTFTLALKIN